MKRHLFTTALILLVSAGVAFSAGEFGTPEEAKAMLEKAVASIKADKTKALAEMQNGGMGTRDRDLYLFCAEAASGGMTLHPTLMGKNVKDLVDKNGKKLGAEMMQVAKEGEVAEVTYFWPRPGEDTTPVEKVSFVTKVDDQMCGVGYYK